MHSMKFISSLIIYTLGSASTITSAEAVPSAQLLPYGFSAFGNYDILSVHEEGDEDVVRIRKRAGDQDCGTDCLDYSAWETDEHMRCDSPELESDSEVVLKKRRKDTELACKNVEIEPGKPGPGIQLISPTWPGVKDLENRYKLVFDIGDPTEPEKPEWFQLKQRDKRWTSDLVGRKTKRGKQRPRCYDAEHVLEWQLLKKFLEADKDKGLDSRCTFLYRYFLSDMPITDHKVQVAKQNGKLDSSNHFEYEQKSFEFGKWRNDNQPTPRAIDWISSQWPGTASGRPPNPWEYELVILNNDANGRKKVLWAGENLVRQPNTESNKMKEVESNSETIEWLFENKYYSKDKGVQKWENNKGICKAIYKFNTLMNLAQYHNHPLIKEIMRAQVRRIGEAWEYLEKNILVGTKWGTENFKERGLKKEWLDWIKEVHKTRLDGLIEIMDDKVKVFEKKSTIITKVKRWDYGGLFKRVVTEPNCGFEKDDSEMKKRVQLLLDAYEKLEKVDSVLELD